MDKIRILYINGGPMSRGGIESFMMNYYRNFNREKIQIDFVVHGFEKGIYDDEIKAIGGRIYKVSVKSKNYFENIKGLRKIFNSGKYRIVHSHLDAMSFVVLKEAKRCGIPIRIAHSHNTQHLTNNKIKFILNEYARKNIGKYATHFFACSKPAAIWLFGSKIVNENKVEYIKNAIDIEKFKYDQRIRKEVRKELNLEDSFVVGHVGRFDYQKNHKFLLDLFYELLKVRINSKLVLVGDGHLRKDIEKRITMLGIKDKVILCGVREDVHRLFNGFDVFCFPSLFEGLSITLMEAQANGLKCVTSNKVPLEANVNNLVKSLSLDSNYRKWINSINISDDYKRDINLEYLYKQGYAIKQESKKLQNLYYDLLRQSNG